MVEASRVLLMKTPSSGELHVARYAFVRRALDELNALFTSGDIALLPDEDITRIVKARGRLMLVRYHGALSGANPNIKHGCKGGC